MKGRGIFPKPEDAREVKFEGEIVRPRKPGAPDVFYVVPRWGRAYLQTGSPENCQTYMILRAGEDIRQSPDYPTERERAILRDKVLEDAFTNAILDTL